MDRTRFALVFSLCIAAVSPSMAQSADAGLAALVASADRSAANSARDRYRHPEETLTFFGVKPDSVVVEILPGGGGYWTEILAPYLKDHGRYIAANGEQASTSAETQKDNAAFNEKFVAHPERYGAIDVTQFSGDRFPIAPPGSADFVLTFRNIHNWMAAGTADAAFAAFYKALKPGGILGVEEHRGRADQPQDPLAKSGYVREDFTIALAQAAASSWLARRRSTPIQRTQKIIRLACGRCRRLTGSRMSTVPNMPRSARVTASR